MFTTPNLAGIPTNDLQAVALLEKMRWKNGFRCRCGYRKHWRVQKRPRVFWCKACNHHTSVTAGTALERTRIPLRGWFVAATLIARPGGCSAASLQRHLGTCYETAWRILHRLRDAMTGPPVRLKATPLISGLGIWCQRPGREQVRGGIAWVWAATDGEHFVSRYSSNETGGVVLAAQHSDSKDVDDARPNPALEHLKWVSLQAHITHQAVSQKWLARYLQEIDFRANFLRCEETNPATVLTAALMRKYETFAALVPQLWCPPTHDLDVPFLGDLALLHQIAPPKPPGPGLRRRDLRR